MAGRPSAPCHLTKGQVIDVAQGFVDTFNWIADTLFNLKADDGVKIDWESPSNPVIRLGGDDPYPGKSKVTFSGTDGSSHTGDKFEISPAEYSNVTATVDANGKIKIGVYYS